MNKFEDNLRRVLRQPEPPRDLAGNVLAHAFRPARRRGLPSPLLRVAAAVVLVAALAAAGFHYRRLQVERIESERARDQVIRAFQLAGEQLRPFQKQFEEMQNMTISIPQGEN
jgi:hypothetical protein